VVAPFKAQIVPYLAMYAAALKAQGYSPPTNELLDLAAHQYGLVLYKYNAAMGPEVAAVLITVALVVPPAFEYLAREAEAAERAERVVVPGGPVSTPAEARAA
jgi:hypothetical protein